MVENNFEHLLRNALYAQRAGRVGEAETQLRKVIALVPDQPVALNSLGMLALAAGKIGEAEAFFERAASADPHAPELHINVAKARRLLNDDAGERRSLEAALALDQRHFVALLRLAELHERREEHVQAIERWGAVLTLIGVADDRGAEHEVIARRASSYLARQRDMLEETLQTALSSARESTSFADRRRFEACVDKVLGKRRIFVNECAGLHFPFLPAEEFFPRTHFPWMPRIEACTDDIRREFEMLLASAPETLKPYVALDPGTPENNWSSLDRSLDWGAIHLWRHGVADKEVCARCPITVAALEALPVADMPGRTPNVFFSLLRPHTRLPAHTGVSNTRAVIHLPLIVPESCGLRVGGETRTWCAGEALAFDDTIEHEAWNESDSLRVVLIFDVWNPHLSGAERDLLRLFLRVVDPSGTNARVDTSD